MRPIPREPSIESTLALLRDPYGFISKGCRRHGSDVFEARILLKPTICMLGADAARLFYDPRRFARRRAAPLRIQKTLFGRRGVQSMDDEAHRHRKQMFMALLAPARVDELLAITATWWRRMLLVWIATGEIVLYDEMQRLLTRAVCQWAGVPLAEAEVERRTRELTALFDRAGSVGPQHWSARLARINAEAWSERTIEKIRVGSLSLPPTSAARIIAEHREPDGSLLDARIAAVELLNVLRPTVAVSVYVTLTALALHQHPRHRAALAEDDDQYAAMFVQEVRRCYPFFPAATARVREQFEWNGCVFPRGRRVLLDLYGTNHDPRIWDSPQEFRPERFRGWSGDPFALIPQGGGDHHQHHRCPGEQMTIELMKQAAKILTGRMAYQVPPQDLALDWSRLPAIPRSRFVMSEVCALT